MAKEVMRRTASDNKYLHKDFHGALSVGLDYLAEHFGEDSIRQYLRQFAEAFYAPLKEDLKRRGLVALADHFGKVYQEEGGDPRITLTDDELRIELDACPAVTHMRQNNYSVSEWFHETTRTVNETICQGTPYAAELASYEPQTGARVERFFRRAS